MDGAIDHAMLLASVFGSCDVQTQAHVHEVSLYILKLKHSDCWGFAQISVHEKDNGRVLVYANHIGSMVKCTELYNKARAVTLALASSDSVAPH